MKKSLMLLLSFAMVFTLFASVAFADDSTTTATTSTQDQYNALVNAGIMSGTVVDGQVVAGLDMNMSRAQYAEVLVNLYNLPKVATQSSFSDVPNNHWAMQQIEAVKAAGYMVGNGDGTFTPDANITLEQLASVICEVNGLTPVAGATTAGADDWAKGYVAAAVNAGLLASSTDYTTNATRANLVNVSYAQYETIQASQKATATFAATGASQITVTFNKAIDDTAAFTVTKGSIPINLTSTKVSDDGMSAVLTTTTKLTAGDYTITGTNPDVSGTVTVTDEKVAKITFTSDKAPLADLTDMNKVYAYVKLYNQYNEDVTAAHVGSLKITSGTGSFDSPTTTGQIGINAPTGTKFTVGQSVSISALYVNGNGQSTAFNSAVLTVDLPSAPQSITISKLANPNDATAAPKVGDNASTYQLYVSATDQYGNPVDAAGLTNGVQIFSTDPSVAKVARHDVTSGGTTTSVPSFTKDGDDIVLPLASPDPSKDGGDFTKGGSTTITMIATRTGTRATFTVNVKAAVKVDTFTASAPSVAVVGEKFNVPFQAVDQFGNAITDASVLKTDGAFITVPQVTGAAGIDASDVYFEQDYVAGTADLVIDARGMTDTGSVQNLYLTAVTSTGNVVNLNIPVQPAAKPVVVTGLTSAVKVALGESATTSIQAKNINVLDQYSRAWTLDHFIKATAGDYQATVQTSDSSVVALSSNNTDTTDATIKTSATKDTLTAATSKTGNSTITVTLQSKNSSGDFVDVGNSAKTVNIRVVDTSSITDYSVAAIKPVYATDATDHGSAVTVTGITADGTSVALKTDDADFYNVTVAGAVYGISYTGGKIYAAATVKDANGKTLGVASDTTIPVTIVGITKDGQKVLTDTVTVSTKTPAATTVALRTTSTDTVVGVTKTGDTSISVVKGDLAGVKSKVDGTNPEITTKDGYTELAYDAVKVTDQYGVEIKTDKFAQVTVTNVKGSDGKLKADSTYGSLQPGDTFDITAITQSGMTQAITVVVTNS